MRRILIETRRPWLCPGYMVVGPVPVAKDYSWSPDSTTILRLECKTIDDPAAAKDRKAEIIQRDGIVSVEISEVR